MFGIKSGKRIRELNELIEDRKAVVDDARRGFADEMQEADQEKKALEKDLESGDNEELELALEVRRAMDDVWDLEDEYLALVDKVKRNRRWRRVLLGACVSMLAAVFVCKRRDGRAGKKKV